MATAGEAPTGGGSVRVEGYDELTEVGRGGFAVVYRARQVALSRPVALKVLAQVDRQDDAWRRFESERQALGQLSWHPHIVVTHDAGVTPDGRPYLAMEFAERGSLADRIEHEGPMAWTEVLDVGVQLAGALESAHRLGVLHRDVKPNNVLVFAYGQCKLADFGIAAIAGNQQTTTGLVATTIAHAAPELLNGQRANVRTDVYALGSTLYTLLVGKPAFVERTDESPMPILLRIGSMPVPDLRPFGIPEPLAALVEAAMAKDPEHRPSSALEVGQRLQELQRAGGRPVTELRLPPLPTPARPAAA
ncbi:MAG: serine/threonine-protein kinase, partial [Acidimicrobiales bacterium]